MRERECKRESKRGGKGKREVGERGESERYIEKKARKR